ncbi:MAG TPA: hypothetical protein VHI52_15860 [Verrucomicrobiae bacterium]|nr:hypothetical protein [Verrucomicrobiae bacterium]
MEELLNAPAEDILSAIQAGFRAIIDVKGKLAEFYLEKELSRLLTRGQIDSYIWQDEDGKPDFLIVRGGKQIKLECKNVRSSKPYAKPIPGYRIELQKTRNSKDGAPTRGYLFTEFDILAACLFNHSRDWKYAFIRASDLEARAEHSELIKIMQCVPLTLTGPWKAAIADVISTF